MKISGKKKNMSFDGLQINIIVLYEENEKIKIIEPYGKLQRFENKPYALIYKKDDKYEPLIYYYNNYAYGYLFHERDKSEIKKTNVIYIQKEPAEITKKTKDKFTIKYTGKDIISEIENKDLIKYDMRCVVEILQDFILDCQTKVSLNKKEIICEDDLNFIMREKYDCEIVKGYYDTYHKLVACKYKKNTQQLEIPFFFKPRSKIGVSYSLSPIKDMEKYKIADILRVYRDIDKLIKETFRINIYFI